MLRRPAENCAAHRLFVRVADREQKPRSTTGEPVTCLGVRGCKSVVPGRGRKAWRHGVFEVLDLALNGSTGPIIVPMTIVEPMYFRETVGRLRDQGHDVRHFALLAHRSTTLRRLRERGLGHAVQLIAGRDASLRVESFAVSRLDLCLQRLQEPEFGEQVWTDHLTIPQVADHIAASAGLSLTPNSDSKLRGRLCRAWVSARQIRFVKTGFRR